MMRLIAVSAVLLCMGFAASAVAQDAAKLAQDKACLGCHQIDKKLVGPSYKEVAARYRDDKGAVAKLVKKVRAGGQGVWGQVPMPPNTNVSEKEADILARWILSQK
jgi:cytochrome c